MRAWNLFPLTLIGLAALLPAAPSIKVSPASLAFVHQEGAATLPAPQTLAVSAASGSGPAAVYLSAGSPWLSFTPLTGRAPVSVRVSVNPATLPIGVYTATLTLTTPETGGDPVPVPVTLTVKAPPADLRASPASLAFTYRLGDPPPPAQVLQLSTTGGLLSFTAAAPGAKWLRLAPASGAVFPGFRSGVSVSVDIDGLVPGTQRGNIAIAAPDAVTKSTPIAVTLTVLPGPAAVTSLWPNRISAGAPDTTVTLTGQRFYSGTTVHSGAIPLRATILGPNLLTAVVPLSLLANPGSVPLTVSNPDPGGGAAAAWAITVLPPGPLILAAVNAASQLPGPLAPGAIVTVYGTGLGPEALEVYDPASPAVPTVTGGTRVRVDGQPVPVIYSSSRQVSAALPNGMVPNRTFQLDVEYGGVRSAPFPLTSAPSAPALFTASGSGAGNAAAPQVDPATGEFSLNSDKTAAPRGSILVLYATGTGPVLPLPLDGTVAAAASPVSIPNVSVLLGDTPADVLYAGAAPGLITGIVQVNLRIPGGAPAGKAVPVTLKTGAAQSPPGVTVNIK